MKKKEMGDEVKAGIWLNQEKAYIFRITGTGEPVMEKVKSNVELQERFGGEKEMGSRSNNFIAGDRVKKQRRQQQERSVYFEEIVQHIRDAGYMYIFGPSMAKHGLYHAIENDNRVTGKVIAIDTAGRMTLNQMKMKVKGFYSGIDFRHLKKELKKLQQY
jgi:hypothetical protein